MFLGFFNEKKVQKNSIYFIEISCDIINVLTVTFDHFNASLLNKSNFINVFYSPQSFEWECITVFPQ